MKKTFAMLLALAIFASLFAGCAFAEAKEETEPVGLANPVHEVTDEELLEETGFAFQEPAGCEDVSYCYIEGDPVIAQMTFTLDGRTWTYRLASAAEETDISGLYYTWKKTAKADVDYNEAKLSWIKNEQGMISWYDAVPGVMYCLSVDTEANKDILTEMANALFCPLQGDAGVSFAADFTDALYHIQQNCQPGTAGSSLKAACLAAECMDLFTEAQPAPEEVTEILKEFADSLAGDDAELFPEQLENVRSAGEELLGEYAEDLLESCGYESENFPWDAELMTACFDAMTLA